MEVYLSAEGRSMDGGAAARHLAGAPVLHPVHFAVAGRLRFRVNGLRHAAALKARLETALLGEVGIDAVSANLLTGTVLILHDPAISPVAIASRLREVLQTPPSEVSSRGSERVTSGAVVIPFRHPPSGRPPAGTHAAEPWHRLEIEEVLRTFGVAGERGLTAAEHARNLSRYGPNILPELPPRSGWSIFLAQFNSLPVVLLSASAILSLFTGGIADAVVIMAVVGINAAIGYVTESRAERTIHSLRRLVRPSALVRREGSLLTVRAEEVVPGDLLALRPGTYITADCRLIEAHHLTVDESVLTGEGMPVHKQTAPLPAGEIPLGDRINMGFRGTFVTGGPGMGVVVGTRDRTEIGRIQSLIGEARAPITPMQQELEHIGNRLVLLSGGICGLIFLLGLLRGQGFVRMLKSSITLAVAAIPEGLPTVATTALALGIGKMKRQQVLIRRLDAMETLGCLQTVCLDKTGTLTLNRMTVVSLQAGANRLRLIDRRFFHEGRTVDPLDIGEIRDLLNITVLCSETEIGRNEGQYVLNGSSTENALVEAALAAGVDIVRLRAAFPLLHTTHRSEQQRLMSTLHRMEGEGGRCLIAMKGSPTEVLSRCARLLRDGGEIPLDAERRQAIELENEEMAGEGLRVLGVALAVLEGEETHLPADRGLTWVGLIGMADPLRPGVRALIERFHRAGIDTAMITGDQVPTAYAVGRELHLQRDGQLEIFESSRLGEVEPGLLGSLARKVHIFARVSPAQKLQIVQALQRGRRVVAMTGDGINDGPALKAADIGIAMGRAGTDLAREVADVVMEDDRLETLMAAIAQGRTTYRNIGKSIHFLLATNMSEIAVMLAATAGGVGHLLTPMQLLWINLVSDIFPGLSLSMEPPEPDVLDRPPRDPQEPILTPEFLRRNAVESAVLAGGSLSAYGYGLARYGPGARAGTVGFLSLVTAQLLHTFSCRSDRHSLFGSGRLQRNPYVGLAVGGSLFLQLLAVAVPGLRRFLGLTPVGFLDGAVIGTTALLPLVTHESAKLHPSVRTSGG